MQSLDDMDDAKMLPIRTHCNASADTNSPSSKGFFGVPSLVLPGNSNAKIPPPPLIPCKFTKMPINFFSSCYHRDPDGKFYARRQFLTHSEKELVNHEQVIRNSELVTFGGDHYVKAALQTNDCVGRIRIQYHDDALSKHHLEKEPDHEATGFWVQGRFFLTVAHVIQEVQQLDESREPRAFESNRLIRGKVTMEGDLGYDIRPEYEFNVKLLMVSAQNDFAIFELTDPTRQPAKSLDIHTDFLPCDRNNPVFSIGYCGANSAFPIEHPRWYGEKGVEKLFDKFEKEHNRKPTQHEMYEEMTVQNSTDSDFKAWCLSEGARLERDFRRTFEPDRRAFTVGMCLGPTGDPAYKMDKFQMFSMNLSSFHGLSGSPVGCVKERSGELKAYICGFVHGGDRQTNNLQMNALVGFTPESLEFIKACLGDDAHGGHN